MREEKEEYRDVIGYKGLYRVSNMGNVLSLARLTNGRNGVLKTSPGRLLKQRFGDRGYARVYLSKDGVVKTLRLHRVVAEAFIPNPDNLPQVNHLDADKTNNTAANLEWCTGQENIQHAVKIGRIKRRTHCRNGHELSGDNLYVRPNGDHACITCRRARARAYRRTLRAARHTAINTVAKDRGLDV